MEIIQSRDYHTVNIWMVIGHTYSSDIKKVKSIVALISREILQLPRLLTKLIKNQSKRHLNIISEVVKLTNHSMEYSDTSQ